MVSVYIFCAILVAVMFFLSGAAFCGDEMHVTVVCAIAGAALIVVAFFATQEEVSPTTATCPTCRIEVSTNFCPTCGWAARQMELHCPTCDAVVDGNFCPDCGLSKEYM